MASLFDNSVKTTKCNNYTVTNNTGLDQTLTIKKMTTNIGSDYEFELIEEVDILNTETYSFDIPSALVYSLNYKSDENDIIVIINTCPIDNCILNNINKLVCCGDCLDCNISCSGTESLGKFIASDTLYTFLIDLIHHHFGETSVFYNYKMLDDYDAIHKISDLLDEIENLCSCTNC